VKALAVSGLPGGGGVSITGAASFISGRGNTVTPTIAGSPRLPALSTQRMASSCEPGGSVQTGMICLPPAAAGRGSAQRGSGVHSCLPAGRELTS
jgi:hypothetical protein